MGDYRLNDSCVDHSYDTLNELLEVIKHIDKNKIMSFAFEDGWKEVDVRKFILKVASYHAKLRYEKFNLEEFSKDFNKKWATRNNECFSTVELIFTDIQETMKSSMRIFLRFSKKMKSRIPFVNGRRMLPAYKGTGLASDYRQLLIPFIESDIVSPLVKDLCDGVLNFFVDVREVLLLCRKVIRQEARIRKDLSRLSAIFESCYNEVAESCRTTIESLKKMESFQVTNPKVKEMNETKDIAKFLANSFHTQTDSEWTDFVIQDKVYKARKEALHPLEEKLWGKDWDKIIKARLAIKYLDELEPQGSINTKENKYRLKGKVIAMLMTCLGITDEDKRKGIFIKYFKDTYKGQYLLLKDNAIYNAFNGWDTKEYKEFEEKIESLLKRKQMNEIKIGNLA